MATSDNCPTCDRPDCQFYTWNAGYKGKGKPPAGYIYDGAASNCYAHAVDWRTRALAVEQERDAVRADRDHLEEHAVRLLQERDSARAALAKAHEALAPLWKLLGREYGDWYLKLERREHANRVDAVLADPTGRAAYEERKKLLALADAVRAFGAARKLFQASLLAGELTMEEALISGVDLTGATVDNQNERLEDVFKALADIDARPKP